MVWTFLTERIGIFWILFNSILCLIVYQFIFKTWNYFADRNVKFVRGLPIFGANYKTLFGRVSFFQSFVNLYRMFPDEKFTGFYDMGGIPKYIIRDPEMIKQISIKDFDYFVNHSMFIHEDSEPVFGRMLFFMKDQKWKDMRSTLSPTFTGSKMRLMFALISEVSQVFCDNLKSAGNNIEYNAKELCSRFASDAIASCAFGLKVNSMEEKENEFYIRGTSMVNFRGTTFLKMLLYMGIPKVMNYFRVKVLKPNDVEFFRNIILDTIRFREKNNSIRNDMINILLEAKKGMLTVDTQAEEQDADAGFATIKDAGDKKLGKTVTKWTDDDLVAQCLLFFFAGFGTVALTVSFILYELAVNPDIQEKLSQEVQDVLEEHDGKPLNYEVFKKMKYLDMVMSETMRRWPQSPASDRQVSKTYVLDDLNGKSVTLSPGDTVWFPTSGLHLDPKYYSDPEKFDPERFSDENKDNIQFGTYLPFGIGPRSCIASRFALMECKTFLFYLIANFQLNNSPKNQIPLKLKAVSAAVEPEKGIWINLRRKN